MPTCDRCKIYTNNFTFSWFNKDLICSTCSEKEKTHAEYSACRKAEHEAVLKGDLNFEFNKNFPHNINSNK